MVDKKKIKILTRGPIRVKGFINGPILTPYYEDINTIFAMLSAGIKIVEVCTDGKEVELTASNFANDNTDKVVTDVTPNNTEVESKVEESGSDDGVSDDEIVTPEEPKSDNETVTEEPSSESDIVTTEETTNVVPEATDGAVAADNDTTVSNTDELETVTTKTTTNENPYAGMTKAERKAARRAAAAKNTTDKVEE